MAAQLHTLRPDVAPRAVTLMLSLLLGMLDDAELAACWVDLLQAVALQATRHDPRLASVLVQLAAVHPTTRKLINMASSQKEDTHETVLAALVYVLAALDARAQETAPGLVDLVQQYACGCYYKYTTTPSAQAASGPAPCNVGVLEAASRGAPTRHGRGSHEGHVNGADGHRSGVCSTDCVNGR